MGLVSFLLCHRATVYLPPCLSYSDPSSELVVRPVLLPHCSIPCTYHVRYVSSSTSVAQWLGYICRLNHSLENNAERTIQKLEEVAQDIPQARQQAQALVKWRLEPYPLSPIHLFDANMPTEGLPASDLYFWCQFLSQGMLPCKRSMDETVIEVPYNLTPATMSGVGALSLKPKFGNFDDGRLPYFLTAIGISSFPPFPPPPHCLMNAVPGEHKAFAPHWLGTHVSLIHKSSHSNRSNFAFFPLLEVAIPRARRGSSQGYKLTIAPPPPPPS
jgi:hypothetical protein